MGELLTQFAGERHAILLPAAAHLGLVIGLYAWLSVERWLNDRRGDAPLSRLAAPGGDAGRAARIAANLSNQFEAPVLFHLLTMVLWMQAEARPLDIALAWVFLAGRVLHTGVQTLTTNVALRGAVFSINFLALCALWIGFFLRAF